MHGRPRISVSRRSPPPHLAHREPRRRRCYVVDRMVAHSLVHGPRCQGDSHAVWPHQATENIGSVYDHPFPVRTALLACSARWLRHTRRIHQHPWPPWCQEPYLWNTCGHRSLDAVNLIQEPQSFGSQWCPYNIVIYVLILAGFLYSDVANVPYDFASNIYYNKMRILYLRISAFLVSTTLSSSLSALNHLINLFERH